MPILDYTINILNLNLNLWNVLSLKWPIYEMSVYEMSFYEKSFYDMFFYELSFYVSTPFYVIICNIHTVDWSGVNLISYSTPFLYCPAPNELAELHCTVSTCVPYFILSLTVLWAKMACTGWTPWLGGYLSDLKWNPMHNLILTHAKFVTLTFFYLTPFCWKLKRRQSL